MSELGVRVANLAFEHSTTLSMMKFLVQELAKGPEPFEAFFEDFEPSGSFLEDSNSIPENYDQLIEAIESLDGSISHVWNQIQSPSKKLANGTKLSREEFYLLRSGLGIFVTDDSLPSPSYDIYDEWDIYSFHYYKDDAKSGYITPSDKNKLGEIEQAFRVRPVQPVDVRKKFLGPSQLEFWEANYPNDFRLFQNI